VSRARSPRPGRPIEVEVKLAVSLPQLVQRVIDGSTPGRLAGFEPSGPAFSDLVTDRYLDTAAPEGRLASAGIQARVRESGSRHTLTLKWAAEADGPIVTRVEVEGPADRSLDATSWPVSKARASLLAAADGLPLVEIAALRQRRLCRRFERDGTAVDVSLDELEALRGGRVFDRRFELEAELASGRREDLEHLAAELLRLPGVSTAVGSKLDFALGRAKPSSPPVNGAATPG